MPWKKGKETRALLAGWRFTTVALSKPGKGQLSPDAKYAGVLILSFSVSRTGKASFVVYKLPSLWHCVTAAWYYVQFVVSAGDWIQDPHTCAAHVLQTKPSPGAWPFFLLTWIPHRKKTWDLSFWVWHNSLNLRIPTSSNHAKTLHTSQRQC